MSLRPTLSVVIAAKNEAHNIGECVESARFADEVLVLDSGSTDGTADLAREAGATVVSTDWPGYGPQQQRGFGLARSDWVLSLDADERITPALQAEILAAIANGKADGYEIPRLSSLCGRFIHHGGWRPDRTLRLARRSKAGFTDHFLHAHMTVDGRRARLRHSLIHYSYGDVHDMLEKLDRYSTGHARDMAERGKRSSVAGAAARGWWAFVRTYLLRAGFLDGSHGLMLAIYNAEYTYYKYLKLVHLRRPPGRPEIPTEPV
jgi:glycosyltransferase involved in cell wall biosynthesis